jgi:hypothetical protein
MSEMGLCIMINGLLDLAMRVANTQGHLAVATVRAAGSPAISQIMKYDLTWKVAKGYSAKAVKKIT